MFIDGFNVIAGVIRIILIHIYSITAMRFLTFILHNKLFSFFADLFLPIFFGFLAIFASVICRIISDASDNSVSVALIDLCR